MSIPHYINEDKSDMRGIMLTNQPFIENGDAGAFTQAIVDTQTRSITRNGPHDAKLGPYIVLLSSMMEVYASEWCAPLGNPRKFRKSLDERCYGTTAAHLSADSAT